MLQGWRHFAGLLVTVGRRIAVESKKNIQHFVIWRLALARWVFVYTGDPFSSSEAHPTLQIEPIPSKGLPSAEPAQLLRALPNLPTLPRFAQLLSTTTTPDRHPGHHHVAHQRGDFGA